MPRFFILHLYTEAHGGFKSLGAEAFLHGMKMKKNKKAANKVIVAIACIFLVAACASLPKNHVLVKDYTEQMKIARNVFPEIYDMYRQGRVEIQWVSKDTTQNYYYIKWRYRQENVNVNVKHNGY